MENGPDKIETKREYMERMIREALVRDGIVITDFFGPVVEIYPVVD